MIQFIIQNSIFLHTNQSEFKNMYTFKSSPLIPHCSNRPKRVTKRKQATKYPEYQIPNNFLSGEQQNFLPSQLIQQIQHMDFISSTSITKINLPKSNQSQRRSSNFTRHLHMMKNAAKKQEQKFHYLITTQNKTNQTEMKYQHESTMINQTQHMSIDGLDKLSIDMENCLNQMNYREMDNEDFNLFDSGTQNEKQPEKQQNNAYFYSQHYIPSENINTDFDCYLSK